MRKINQKESADCVEVHQQENENKQFLDDGADHAHWVSENIMNLQILEAAEVQKHYSQSAGYFVTMVRGSLSVEANKVCKEEEVDDPVDAVL
jgi:hypothetical protein